MAQFEYQEEVDQMLQLTENYVKELTSVWTRTFDGVVCQGNLHKLYEHAKNFYHDLVSESLEKQSYIENEIAELQKEAENLKRLLKTEVELPLISEKDGVPLMTIQREMDKSLSDLREQLRRRREQICDLLLEQDTLCEELGESPRPLLADPLPTAEELEEFRNYIDSLKELRVERMQELMAIRREIKNSLHILDLNINTEADDRLLNHRELTLNKETFENLDKLKKRFAKQVLELKTRIDVMRQQLPTLWDRLNTPLEERRKIERYDNYSQFTHDILYQEMERCETIKRENLKQYIQNIRVEIEMWWDKTLKSEIQRKRFTNFNSHIYTDELLTLHEMELEDLKNYYERNYQIFDLYDDRKVLWERMIALEQKASDPGRYNNRGGQLLREEKERKTIATKLPKIEQQLKELVLQYQEREHEAFLVYGKNILEVMEEEWEKKRQNKEAQSSARKNAVTPQPSCSNRSQMSSNKRTPLSQRNASSALLSRTPSNSNLSSSKRIILGSTSQKRKLHPSEQTTSKAKRSLWNSSSGGGVFLKPPSVISAVKGNAARNVNSPQTRKKVPRVIATTIRRRSEVLTASGAKRKRRSLNKSGRVPSSSSEGNKGPKIMVTEPNSTDDENYDSFKKRIEPDSRSSIQQDISQIDPSIYRKIKAKNSPHRNAKHRHQQNKLTAIEETKEDKLRLATLPKPQMIRTPSKQNINYPLSPITINTSPSKSTKLSTKNLPILI